MHSPESQETSPIARIEQVPTGLPETFEAGFPPAPSPSDIEELNEVFKTNPELKASVLEAQEGAE